MSKDMSKMYYNNNMKKRIFSLSSRKKMSLAKIGKHPWNYGLDQTDPRVKRNIENSQRSQRKVGWRITKKHAHALMAGRIKSAKKRGSWTTKEGLANIINKQKGCKFTKSHCLKISKANRGKPRRGLSKKLKAYYSTHSVWNKGKTKATDQRIAKYSNTLSSCLKGRDAWNKGKTGIYSKASLERMSIVQHRKATERLEKRVGRILPAYNLSSISFFNDLNKVFSLDGQHAENHGEYQVKELGYWLDFYSPKYNIAIEWDEEKHYTKNGKLRRKDIIRQRRIEQILGCLFLRVRQSQIEKFDYNTLVKYLRIHSGNKALKYNIKEA